MTTPSRPCPCPACGQGTFVEDGGTGTCSRCGYASGEGNRCPHCRAVARIEGVGKSAVCAACAGPRIPLGFGGMTAESALREQKNHLQRARLASVATVAQAVFAAIATLIALAILPASILGKLVVVLIAIVPIVLALRSRSRATTSREKATDAGERAWQAAAEEIAAGSKDGITASSLAKSLGIEPAYADALLTSLAVHDRTRVDVGDDAEVVYSVAPKGPVRISSDGLTEERTEDMSEDERQDERLLDAPREQAAPEPRGRAR